MAEIKISELSIGDWVKSLEKPMQVYWIEGKSVGMGTDNVIDYSCNVVEVAPIHLTPEILEKNGLEYVDDDNDAVIFLSCDLFWARLCVGDTFWRVGIHTEDKLDAVVCDVRAVHQLQHALRLAGVEKEIEV